ncbi:hypothetical protein DASB73_011630 [Starmerella bacillaris]|uniref:Uncharacterized protein n=1 Tax=Starmerella bacillaris TaxID=1247836 RepID=A0AAV5RFP5_STABA|nr:hypothetical protein DASB73_011630 [Starmerella bacillaris]
MEVSGIDPEIVAGQNGPHATHQTSAANSQVPPTTNVSPGTEPSREPKQELDAPDHSDNVESSLNSAHMMNARNAAAMVGADVQNSQHTAAAALAANQYAAAAAYGPPVPVQPQPTHQTVDPAHGRVGKRRVRLGWTEEETRNLMEGCKRFGVGNWKKILTDPSLHFNCRTAVDLKDRFRTSFPEEYSRLYPNARTHKVKRATTTGSVPSLIKVSRKERRAFTADEDERLLQGFLAHGPAWSKIQKDQSLGLGDRRSTDLRDRFRNAFPERYTAAGYKGRSVGSKAANQANSASVSTASDIQIPGALDDDLAQQHGVLNNSRYMPNAQMFQQLQYQQQFPQASQYNQNQRTQQYGNQAQTYQQYQQPAMFYGMGMNAQMPVQMAGMNQMGQMNPQMNAQMRQVPQMNLGHMGVWQNQQQ